MRMLVFHATFSEKGRKAVLQNAADAVKAARNLHEDNVTELPKDLPKVCLFFFLIELLLP